MSMFWRYYRGAQGIILCYDCTQRSTFEHVKYWQDEVRRYSTNQDAILMLVSNKVDLPEVQVSRTEGEEKHHRRNGENTATPARGRARWPDDAPLIAEPCSPGLDAGSAVEKIRVAEYLVRHGESTWNSAAKRWDLWQMFSQVDHPLTEQGIQQAKRLRDAAAQARDLAPPEQSVVDASLVEKVWWNKFWESKTEMQERLKRLLQTIEPAMPGQSSVLVCHSLLIQRLFKDFAAPSLVKERKIRLWINSKRLYMKPRRVLLFLGDPHWQDPEKQQLLSGLRSRKLQNCGAVRLRLDTGQIHDVELAFGTKLV
eukprot:g27592.t1